MRNDDIEYMIEKNGEATTVRSVPKESIEKWQGKLPDSLINFWETEGWNTYQNGLFTIINPDDYQDTVDEWLEGTGIETVDTFHPYAMTAFGSIYLCGEQCGVGLSLDSCLHMIFGLRSSLEKKDKESRERRMLTRLSSFDLKSCDTSNKLFLRAIKKYGPLGDGEIFGFKPAPILGGNRILKNVVKVDAQIYYSMLKSFADPYVKVLDFLV